ncbi:hypothetical protein P280DRAFT_3310 [Massarina eburnea CBS 473.64]|uniref:DUF6590 domain-containing protein n=1 Tax=Massarina eburnea CBS 473.64 TaxID=1395130 RepID=A0A6A6SHJ2_9PLEO|nr:hypothetical protein P280DRAFT_3310 [Massarina eburnea CBS 473.64]
MIPHTATINLAPERLQTEEELYESLDPSYSIRLGYKARQFFVKGRVFAMLYSEAASDTLARRNNDNDAFSVLRYRERAFSQIRRFVIVSATKPDFVYACAISTYSGKGTAKPGVIPSEHSAVYLTGTEPSYVTGERESGLRKYPIAITPAEQGMIMSPFSRLQYSKMFTVEKTVEVKDIGRVIPEDMSKLLKYWKEELYSSVN